MGASRQELRRAARRVVEFGAAPLRALRTRLRALSARPGPPSCVHVSWSEDPSSTLTITWQTPTRMDAAEVLFRRADDGETHRATAASRRVRGTSDWVHRATLRGLAPSTSYLYAIVSGRDAAPGTPWQAVRTAPALRSEAYHAVFVCDVGLAGRSDGTSDSVRAVLHEIAADAPLFYLGGGDYAYVRGDGRFRDPGQAIERWFDQMAPLFAGTPFMAQYGNHEVELGESLAEWAARFAHPRGSRDGYSYSFDVGPAHFAALFAPGRAPSPLHLQWLEEDLSSEAARRAAWRIVYQHAPVFASGSSHPARAELGALRPLLERLDVDLHLSGHDQSYERTHPLRGADREAPMGEGGDRAQYAAGRGVVYAKVSPAGKLSERGRGFSRFAAEPGPEIAVRDDRAHHWARLSIGERELAVSVLGLAHHGAAVRTVDHFALVRQ
jgi:hypothetical protein